MKKNKLIIAACLFAVLCLVTLALVSGLRHFSQKQRQPLDSVLALQLNEASQLISSGQNAEARDRLKSLAKEYPSNEMLSYNIGITYMRENDYRTAIKFFGKSIKINPTMGAHLNRAWCYKALGENEKAIDDYSHVIATNPEFAHAYYERGFLYMLQKRGDMARADLERAQRLGLSKAATLLEQL